MEASAATGPAGTASGDGGAQQQQQDGQAADNGAAQGQDAIAQMAETLQGLSDGQEQMRQFLETAGMGQEAPEQPVEEPPGADLSFLDESSPNYDPQQAAERLTQVMREQAGVATQAELNRVL